MKKTLIGIGIFLLLIGMIFFFTNGNYSVVSFNKETADTGISCSLDTDCSTNNEFLEIKDIIYCENTCKFERPDIEEVWNE